MTVSYSDATRRDDLRAAALYVIDEERQERGYDKRVRGSLGLPDVGRIFEEMLAVFALESEVGASLRSADEIPCWSVVLDKLEPLWERFPRAPKPDRALIEGDEWRALREAISCCVERYGLWLEEVEFPVTVAFDERLVRVDSWRALERLDHLLLGAATITDCRGRNVELEVDTAVTVRRVGLPTPDPP
jgi:hypothetical protein